MAKRKVKPLRKIPKPKPPKMRTHITLSKACADMFKREFSVYEQHQVMAELGYPNTYLIGEDGRKIIKDFEKLIPVMDGCREMPTITSNEITNAYLRLAGRNLTPCAVARVGTRFANGNLWDDDSGYAIFNKNMAYILTYDGDSFTAATVRDKNTDALYTDPDDYCDKYDNLVEIEVRIGK